MTWSSTRPAVHTARDVDSMIAAEWALEDLHSVRNIEQHSGGGRDAQAAAAEAARLEQEAEAAREAAVREEQERAVAEAYERGLEEGRRLGEEGEAARLRSAVEAANLALDELREGEMRWTGSIEENICALSVAIARQVIGRELSSDVESVVQLVRNALTEFPVDQPIRIRVSPADLAAIEGGEQYATAITRDRDARWLADPRIVAGGCVVEGRERIVDGRVDSALERIYRRLTYTHV